MNLGKKRELAAKALDVGKNRVYFNPESLNEIKEAITKQDIKALYEEGIIRIKPVKGRKKVVLRKRRRGPGKIKMKVKHRKQDYVKITRKLRGYLKTLNSNNKISKEVYYDIRKKIKMRVFKNMAHLKEYLQGIETAAHKSKKTAEGKSSDKKGSDKKTKEKKAKWN